MNADHYPRIPYKAAPWPGGQAPRYVLEALADDDDPEVAAAAQHKLDAMDTEEALPPPSRATITPVYEAAEGFDPFPDDDA